MQESSQPVADKYKRPPCADQLLALFGHNPRDRGALISAGGHGIADSGSGDSPRTPQGLSAEPPAPPSGTQGSRPMRDHSVTSPSKKRTSRTASLDDCVADFTQYMERVNETKLRRLVSESDEVEQVRNILIADGMTEVDPLLHQALNLCAVRIHRQNLLSMRTKDGRENYIRVSWEVFNASSK